MRSFKIAHPLLEHGRREFVCQLGEISKKAYRCGLYEAQDVLLEIDDVGLIRLDTTIGRVPRWNTD